MILPYFDKLINRRLLDWKLCEVLLAKKGVYEARNNQIGEELSDDDQEDHEEE